MSLSYPLHLALARRRYKPAAPTDAAPHVGIVVPIRGAEEGLEANLAALIAQQVPGGVEVVLVAEDADDPGFACARRAAAGHEHVRLVLSGPAGDVLGKGHNLVAGLRGLEADVIVLADSDARPPAPDFVARLVTPFRDPHVGLVTCVPGYRDARDLGAHGIAALINTDVAGLFGVLSAWDHLTTANGTCLAVRASRLAADGGPGWMRTRLLMDSALARRVHGQGDRVVLHTEPVPVHRTRMSLTECWAQTRRWYVAMRFGLPFAQYLGVGWLRSGPLLALAAYPLLPGAAGVTLLVATVLARALAAAAVSRLFLRDRAPLGTALLVPLADLAATAAWWIAFIRPEVRWRGTRYSVGAGAVVTPHGTPRGMA